MIKQMIHGKRSFRIWNKQWDVIVTVWAMLLLLQMAQKSPSGLVWLQQQPVVPFHGTAAQDGSCCRLPRACSLHSPCFVSPEAGGVPLKLGSDASKVPSVRIHGVLKPPHTVDGSDSECIEKSMQCDNTKEEKCDVWLYPRAWKPY